MCDLKIKLIKEVMASTREFSCEARGSVRPTRVFRFKSNYLPRHAVSGKKKK